MTLLAEPSAAIDRIRIANPEDAPALARLLLPERLAEFDLPTPLHAESGMAEAIAIDISTRASFYFVSIDSEGDITGCIGVAIEDAPPPHVGKVAQVFSLVVDPAVRGACSRVHLMMMAAAEFITVSGASIIACSTLGDRRHGHYRRMGFVPHKTILHAPTSKVRSNLMMRVKT